MPFEERVQLAGSERTPMPGAALVGSIQPDDIIRVSVILRHKSGGPKAVGGQHIPHEAFEQQHGADPQAIAAVEEFAHRSGLAIVESSARKRRVILSGTARALSQGFGAQLHCYRLDTSKHEFRGRTGALSIPAELQGSVIAILGLDSRPAARPHFRTRKASATPAAAAPTSFTPPQVARLYNYPTGSDGTGQTIAIVELGGGYKASDLSTYFKGLSIKEPKVSAVSVDGGTNSPGGSADGEVLLDIEVAGSIAPGANIAVYFAPNTDQGFIDAITDAAHDTTRKPSVISISWGAPEDSWTAQSRTAMNAALQDAAALGVTVTVASGDNGSTDGVGDRQLHVDFPASSPYALACGGTKLEGSGGHIASETVWNETANQEGATGGGVSRVFPVPSYQSSAKVPMQPETKFAGRGVPDVAGDADPTTGYQVLVNGQQQVIGGTSAVAPLWAALVALINQKLGKPAGFLNPTLYGLNGGGFRDITTGNNDDSGLGSYSARAGWDPCTGLGSPDGAALISALQSGSTPGSGT
jgi:kumamolisin